LVNKPCCFAHCFRVPYLNWPGYHTLAHFLLFLKISLKNILPVIAVSSLYTCIMQTIYFHYSYLSFCVSFILHELCFSRMFKTTFCGFSWIKATWLDFLVIPSSHPPLSSIIRSHFLWASCMNGWECRVLAKPSSNLLQRTGGDHQGSCAQPGWRTFVMTCLCWILGYMRLEIWHKIGLSGDWCLCTALHTHSGACYYWIGWEEMCVSC